MFKDTTSRRFKRSQIVAQHEKAIASQVEPLHSATISAESNCAQTRATSEEQWTEDILYRALARHDRQAWEEAQRQYGKILRDWMRCHPNQDAACRLHNEDYYITQAFVNLWQASAEQHELACSAQATALRCLHAHLNGAVIETLRTSLQPEALPLHERDDPMQKSIENQREFWQVIDSLFPDTREQRLAYLLYHCLLKPREIVRYCPQEFSDLSEIYRLRCKIIERLLN